MIVYAILQTYHLSYSSEFMFFTIFNRLFIKVWNYEILHFAKPFFLLICLKKTEILGYVNRFLN